MKDHLDELIDLMKKSTEIIQLNSDEIKELRSKIDRLEKVVFKKKTISCKNRIDQMCDDLYVEEKKRRLENIIV